MMVLMVAVMMMIILLIIIVMMIMLMAGNRVTGVFPHASSITHPGYTEIVVRDG